MINFRLIGCIIMRDGLCPEALFISLFVWALLIAVVLRDAQSEFVQVYVEAHCQVPDALVPDALVPDALDLIGVVP